MRAQVNPKQMILALRHVKPMLAPFQRASFIRAELSAADNLIRLQGPDGTVATFACVVEEFGRTEIPIQAAAKVLSTFRTRSFVQIRAEPGAIWIEAMKFAL